MAWRLPVSLETLLHRIDDRFPMRSTAFDGSIGDAEQRAPGSESDHNPWFGPGIVTAGEFTRDPAHGPIIVGEC
ncbi:hypothetical protein OG689_38695 [Kitasatospora sp. NBC_00240]|uniref:hypothetical protein n=1 Tax=Kitasatospora sp. NBC_00240 TaxID=2903567 RepID=UPI002257A7E8|nr:hypothetical protein [Kitasatospora sp. NBC_00240]MCX5215126.1 hypothetical protein [Kitasatospora sp. NBC_00240]